MTSSSLMVAAAVLSFGLVGCATTSSSPARVQMVEPVRVEIDHEKMSIVDTKARRNGVSVLWVNAPTRRIASQE